MTFPVSALDYEELIQSHPVATWLLDGEGRILIVNAAAEQLCNMGRAAMLGGDFQALVRLESDFSRRMRETGNPVLVAHGVEILVGDQRAVRVDLQSAPCGVGEHHIVTMIPVEWEANLRGGLIGRSGQAAGAAASMLAHEIKNPLAGIKGAAQLIARDTGPATERFTSLICSEVDRIAKLIDQMEHFSRGRPLSCAPINPYPAIHQALETARAQDLTSVLLVEDFDPSIPMMLGNHDAMVQILLNLLRNAVDAVSARDEGVIRISSAFRHGLSLDNGDGRGRLALPIEITVSDNGPGVADEVRDALFDPFVTTKREGRGLGLALVAKLTRDMGGAVQYSRDASWSHFRLHLPAAMNRGIE